MQFTSRGRGSLLAAGVMVGIAGCGTAASATPVPSVGYVSPTPTPSPSATASVSPTPHPGTMVVTPGYGTDGSLVEVVVSGAPADTSGSLALCSLSAAATPASCDPVAFAVATDRTGGFVTYYTISQVPAPSTKGYAVVFTSVAGAVLASSTFDPDIATTPTPYPTYSYPTADAHGSR